MGKLIGIYLKHVSLTAKQIYLRCGGVNYGFSTINTHGNVQPTKHAMIFEKVDRTKTDGEINV